MGYLPKHIKVRHQKGTLRMIAHAALAGAVIKQMKVERINGTVLPIRYQIQYLDGQESRYYDKRSEAAAHYLVWWFQKNDMWPRYK